MQWWTTLSGLWHSRQQSEKEAEWERTVRKAVVELLRGTLYVIGIISIGVFGYVLLEDYSYLDALYQTVITLTTVGYGEVQELNRDGQIFTIFLMLFGITFALIYLGKLADLVVNGQVKWAWNEMRKRNMLQEWNGHTVYIGVGKMGLLILRKRFRGSDGNIIGNVVVVDIDGAAVDEVRERGWTVIKGDATDKEVLDEAGIERAAELWVMTGNDAANAFVTLWAKHVNQDIRVTARCVSPENREVMRAAAMADVVVSPLTDIAEEVVKAQAEQAAASS